jgi:predicted Zn finger-like uncharacterized protein
MRFECDNCHAKYKIAEEKIRGRIVRFPCRNCDHKIVIDGRAQDADVTVPAGAAYGFEEVTRRSEPASRFVHEAATARARRPSSPIRRRPASVPPRRPSAASRRASSVPPAARTALVGQHPGLALPVPAAGARPGTLGAGDVPEWHVSIQDVPVGPIRLEEMAHKIDAGAVSEYSLVWREGFEEWRPLATVPELVALLHERRHSGPPARTSFSSMPPFVESRVSGNKRPKPAPPPAPRAAASTGDFAPLSIELGLQPEAGFREGLDESSQPPAPIGPADVFQSSPQLGSFSGLPPMDSAEVSVPSVPPEPAVAMVEPRRGLSLGVLAMIVAISVFSAVAAFLAFDRFGDSLLRGLVGTAQRAVSAEPAPVPAPRKAEAPAVEAEKRRLAPKTTTAQPLAKAEAEAPSAADATEDDAAESDAANEEVAEPVEPALAFKPPDPASDGATIAPREEPSKPRIQRKARAKPVAAGSEAETLSAEEQELLNDFDSSSNTAFAKIDVKEPGAAQGDKPPLDGDAVRATVTANKPRLQRCYERAVRGQQSPPAVRLDVTVMLAPSGRVKDVNAEGSAPGGLADCIAASVRRWRFPASSEGGPARFPIIFSGN